MFVNRNGSHTMSLCAIRTWGPSSKAVTHRYREDEVDFFLGYVVETDAVYVLPYDATRRIRGKLGIWILRQPVGTNGSVRFDPTPYKNPFHLMEQRQAQCLRPGSSPCTVSDGAVP